MRYKYYSPDNQLIGFYELNGFPGCNQIAVSNHAWIAPAFRGLGYGNHAHEQRLKEAKELGYDYITCTTLVNNIPQNQILTGHGWRLLDTIRNRETNNDLYLWGRPL